MSFIINNVLTAEGSKKDIQRFIETFTAEKLESLCMLDYFEVEKSEPDTCTIVYPSSSAGTSEFLYSYSVVTRW